MPGAGCRDGRFDFSKVPNVKPQPPGYFFPLPDGPGYYTFQDFLNGNERSGPPKYPYQRSASQFQPLYDVDWRYLDDPDYQREVWTENLKRIKFCDDWMFSTGGQAWSRYMNIPNQQLGTGRNIQDLGRVRPYFDLWYQDEFRIYTQLISAGAINGSGTVPDGPNDVKTFDFEDLFIDLKLFEFDNRPFYARVGREEMALGSQRLISNIDFTNTMRFFQGVRGTYRGQNWDYDIWWLRPLVNNPYRLDSWDDKQDFAGSFGTYHFNKTDMLDLYWLYLDNQNVSTKLNVLDGPQQIQTPGFRYVGNNNGFLWDFENAMQFGTNAGRTVFAGMSTSGIGYNWHSCQWNPTLWLLYDFASGTHYAPGPNSTATATGNGYNTFNQMFAFGHNYLGTMDLFGRENINDVNLHLHLNPTDWISFWTQYHYLWLDSRTDALYGFSGTALRRDATGQSGRDVGSELNFITNFHLTSCQDLQVGYGHLFGGEFMRKTGSSTVDYTYVTYGIKW